MGVMGVFWMHQYVYVHMQICVCVCVCLPVILYHLISTIFCSHYFFKFLCLTMATLFSKKYLLFCLDTHMNWRDMPWSTQQWWLFVAGTAWGLGKCVHRSRSVPEKCLSIYQEHICELRLKVWLFVFSLIHLNDLLSGWVQDSVQTSHVLPN